MGVGGRAVETVYLSMPRGLESSFFSLSVWVFACIEAVFGARRLSWECVVCIYKVDGNTSVLLC